MGFYPNAVVGEPMSMKDLERRLKEEEQNTSDTESNTDDPASQEENVTLDNPQTEAKGKEVNWEKRYRDLQSYHTRQLNELKAELQKQKVAKPLVSEADLQLVNEIKNEHADTYALVSAVARKEVEDQIKEMREELERLRKENEVVVQKTSEEKAWMQIEKAHPDAKKLGDDPVFTAWYEEQPARIQELAKGSPDEVIYLISMFKRENGISQKDSKVKQKAATAAPVTKTSSEVPNVTGKKIWTVSEIAALSRNLNEYAKYQDEIALARREGRININA